MRDYFLHSATREQIDQALRNAGLLFYESDEPVVLDNVAIDYVGVVDRPTGRLLLDSEGEEYPEMAPVEGYHVNLRAALTEEQKALLPIIPEPDNPQRIFAGGILR